MEKKLTEEEFIKLAKMIEMYIQYNKDYTNDIVGGNFSTRFVKLYKEYLEKPIINLI